MVHIMEFLPVILIGSSEIGEAFQFIILTVAGQPLREGGVREERKDAPTEPISASRKLVFSSIRRTVS